MRCDVEHHYAVTPLLDRRSSPSPFMGSSGLAGIGLGAALRAEKQQMRDLVSEAEHEVARTCGWCTHWHATCTLQVLSRQAYAGICE